VKFTEEPEFSFGDAEGSLRMREKIQGGGGRQVLLMMSILGGQRGISRVQVEGQIDLRICDNRRIIADEIVSEMNVMEVIGARMVKGPTEGILF
jgi:hypothetical protein